MAAHRAEIADLKWLPTSAHRPEIAGCNRTVI